MRSDDDLRPLLRRHLGAAVGHHDRIAVAALREAIAALDNAEAIPPDGDLEAEVGEYVAGGVVGLGAAEAERRILVARRQGVQHVESLDDLACPELWDSDEEYEWFLVDLYASRQSGVA